VEDHVLSVQRGNADYNESGKYKKMHNIAILRKSLMQTKQTNTISFTTDQAIQTHLTDSWHDVFTAYKHIPEISIGVGGVNACKTGQGDTHLNSKYKGTHIYSQTKKNVLHIPSNKNNLLLLGQGDSWKELECS
jgi:hypothetical protein